MKLRFDQTVGAGCGEPDAGGAGFAASAGDAGSGASGKISQPTRYAAIAGKTGTGRKIKITHTSRTTVGSTSRYSATPPHTPAILLSVEERISRLGAGGADGVELWRAPQ